MICTFVFILFYSFIIFVRVYQLINWCACLHICVFYSFVAVFVYLLIELLVLIYYFGKGLRICFILRFFLSINYFICKVCRFVYFALFMSKFVYSFVNLIIFCMLATSFLFIDLPVLFWQGLRFFFFFHFLLI